MTTTSSQHASEFKFGWTVVLAAAFGVGAGVTGVNTYSLGVFLGPLSDEFGWSRMETSAAKTFLTLGYVLTAPFIGYIVDRFGPRKIGLASMATFAIAALAMTQMNGSITIYYLAYFLLALAGCATTPLVWTRGVATWFQSKRGLALGLTLTGSGVAGIITPPLIGGLIDSNGWQAGYVGMAVLAALAIIPIYLLFFENRHDHKASPEKPATVRPYVAQSGFEIRDVLKSRRFWQIGLAFALIGGSVSALVVHLIPMLTDSGVSRDVAVRYAGLIGAAVIAGRLATGYLVDRFHPPYVAGTFLILPAIGCGLLATGALSPPFVLAAAITFGLAAGSEVDLVPYLAARYFGLKSYGKVYGWMFVLFYAGVGIGPLFLGRMFDVYGNYTFALTIIMPVLAAGALAIALLGKPPKFEKRILAVF
ncbi:MAG: MFS transporter [Rhodobacteraceae bacterium]|nr:MFS transporter [Paracoccaceae bacterium]